MRFVSFYSELQTKSGCRSRTSVPNIATVEAMQELEEGRGTRFESAEKLFEDIGV